MIAFDVVGQPAPQGSKKAFVIKGKNGGRDRAVLVESSKSVKSWRQIIADAAQDHAPNQPLEGPLHVSIQFRMPVPKSAPKSRRLPAIKRPDIDKLARAALDALKGIVWRDDSQIVGLSLEKVLAYDHPIGCTIAVTVSGPVEG